MLDRPTRLRPEACAGREVYQPHLSPGPPSSASRQRGDGTAKVQTAPLSSVKPIAMQQQSQQRVDLPPMFPSVSIDIRHRHHRMKSVRCLKTVLSIHICAAEARHRQFRPRVPVVRGHGHAPVQQAMHHASNSGRTVRLARHHTSLEMQNFASMAVAFQSTCCTISMLHLIISCGLIMM